MNKVVVVNLNGSAYQLEEGGYIALRAYLDHAGTQLRENPDKAEILSDLEQAIGEKCDQFLGAHKDVVTAEEVDRILREMGPVHDPSAANANAAGAEGSQAGNSASEPAAAPKRLYQVREGEMISGVCNGFAAYFGIDVTVMRVIFVVLAFVTSGAWILVYLVMMIVIPHANTQEERAAARGLPFNAQELINGVKKKYADFSDSREARRRRRAAGTHRYEKRAHMFHRHEPPRASAGYTAHIVTGLLSPVFGLISAALFVLFISAFITIARTGAVLGWPLPPQIPMWAGLLILVALYMAMHGTITTARRATYAFGGRSQAWFAVLDGVFWLAFCALFLWIAYLYVPGVEQFFDRLLSMWDPRSIDL